jgi:hypothetical protein
MTRPTFPRTSLLVGVLAGTAVLALLWVSFAPLSARTNDEPQQQPTVDESLQSEATPLSPDDVTQLLLQLSEEDFYIYTDPMYGFSLPYPKFFTFLTFNEGEREGIILRSDNLGMGIQITISPLDENLPLLTPERLLQDIPELTSEQITETYVGPNQDIPALAFPYTHPEIGETGEVRFLYAGNLYQLSIHAPPEWLEPWAAEILLQFTFGDVRANAM